MAIGETPRNGYKANVFDVDEREIIWGKEAVMRIFFLIALSVASLGAQALTVVPSRHLVCEKYPGTMLDKECKYVPGRRA